MTQSLKNSIILKVTSLKLPLLAFTFLAFSAHSVAYGASLGGLGNWFKKITGGSKGVSHSRRAGPTETHAGVMCPEGLCSFNNLRREPLRSIDTGPNLALGVDRALQTLYRSCSAQNPISSFFAKQNGRFVSDYGGIRTKSYNNVTFDGVERRTVTNSRKMAQNGPYTRDVNNGECSMPKVNGQTIDMRDTGVHFQYGATMQYLPGQGLSAYRCYTNQTDSYCNTGRGSERSVALDCAEFVGMSAASSCLKFTKNDNFRHRRYGIAVGGTRELSNDSLADSLKRSDSCYQEAPQNSSDFLRDGDLIFGTETTHAAVITNVGPDPLGIEKALRSREGCDSIGPSDLNFSLAHSSSVDSIGPIKSTAEAYFWLKNASVINNPSLGTATPYPLDILLTRAKSICEELQRNPNATRFPPSFSPHNHLVRHTGAPGCVMDKDECTKVIGDECADKCLGPVHQT